MHKALISLMLIFTLSGCGGGGGGTSSAGGTSSGGSASSGPARASPTQNTTAVGAVQVRVTNPALPPVVTTLGYTVARQDGTVVVDSRFAYESGTPPLELFSGVPSETDTVTVRALDAGGSVVIQGQAQVYVPVGAAPTAVVTIGPPRAIAQMQFLSQPSSVVAGARESTVVVGLVDATNNLAVAASDPVTISLGNAGGAGLGGNLTVIPNFGLATFSGLTVNQLGHYTLIATAPGAVPIASGQFDVVAAAGPPSKLAFTVEPFPNTTINVPFAPAPEVAVEDASGVIVDKASDTVQLAVGNNPGGSFLAGTVTLAAAQGIATFDGTSLNGQGSGYTLTAAASGLVPASSTPFTMLFDQSGPNPQTGNVDSSGDGNGIFNNI